MPREITVTARYPNDPDHVFAKALSFADMADVSRGVAVYKDLPQGDLEEGRTYTLNVTVWGVMRNPNYQVHVEHVDPAARRVQSREHGWMIRQWDHTLEIRPEGDGALWSDRIVIDCSWATGFMGWVARVMYRTRHRNRGGGDVAVTMRRV